MASPLCSKRIHCAMHNVTFCTSLAQADEEKEDAKESSSATSEGASSTRPKKKAKTSANSSSSLASPATAASSPSRLPANSSPATAAVSHQRTSPMQPLVLVQSNAPIITAIAIAGSAKPHVPSATYYSPEQIVSTHLTSNTEWSFSLPFSYFPPPCV